MGETALFFLKPLLRGAASLPFGYLRFLLLKRTKKERGEV